MTAEEVEQRLALATKILDSESFMWLMCGDPDWTQAHIAAIRPAWLSWRAER